ncbi:MAG: acyltransferase family protein [Acidimicrobiia bacterium]
MEYREAGQLDPLVELRYRPYLDGLRCVAVYLVVAFHAGLGSFSGGFIGVDVFFVLSGFLVTRILLGDLVSAGRINFRRFYSRRFRRILPAAAVMLLVTAVAYVIVASPLQAFIAVSDFRAAFLYFANWHFIQQSTDYFATNVNSSPVLHFWSLAVEEQFYLTWPLLLSGLFVVARLAGRRRWLALRIVVVAAILASATEALTIGAHQLDRAYYGTDTRAYQLLAGALLALTPQLFELGSRYARLARLGAPIALGAIVVLGSSILKMSAITRGVVVVIVTLVLITALEGAHAGRTNRALSASPITYLGRISYATYLWHWPIDVLVLLHHQVSPLTLFGISSVGATLLAAISFRVLEHPIRASTLLDRYRMPVIAGSLTVSVVAALFFVPAILEAPSATANIAQASLAVPRIPPSSRTLLNWHTAQNDIPAVPNCLGEPVDDCIIVHGTGARVLLMGDSLARMWIPAFVTIAKRDSLTLAVASYPACPWQQLDRHGLDQSPNCPAQSRFWYDRVVPEFNPDIIVLAERAFDAPGNVLSLAVNGQTLRASAGPAERELANVSRIDLSLLHRPGRKIVILEPTPLPPALDFNPLECLSTGNTRCYFGVNPALTGLQHEFEVLANNRDVLTLNLDHLVCPRLPICDPVVNNIIVRRDHTHLTGTYAGALAGPIEARLEAHGILPTKT